MEIAYLIENKHTNRKKKTYLNWDNVQLLSQM